MPAKKTKRTVDIHGYALRAIRETKRVTGAELADMLDCDRSYITRIENGYQRRVGVNFYNALLDVLNIKDARALYATAPDRTEDAA